MFKNDRPHLSLSFAMNEPKDNEKRGRVYHSAVNIKVYNSIIFKCEFNIKNKIYIEAFIVLFSDARIWDSCFYHRGN